MNLVHKYSTSVKTQFGFFKNWVKYKVDPGLYERARFSFWSCIVITLCQRQLINTRDLQRLHWDLNTWKDEEVQQWKNSHLASCNSIAVAGAIFATLGLTALQIPDMNEAWWIARAFCVASMVLGVFSVITATRQHLDVVMLKSPLNVRLWLSRGQQKDRHGLPRWNDSQTQSKYANVPGFKDLPLESSVMSLKAVTLPKHLLDLSVAAFMFGIGMYELSGWLAPASSSEASCPTVCLDGSSNEEAVEESPDVASVTGPHEAYRSVFIVFIVTLALCLVYWFKIWDNISFEQVIKDEDFGTSQFGKGENIRMTSLRKELKRVQQKFRLDPPDLPESEGPDVVKVLQELSRDLKNRDDQWRQIFAHTLRLPPHQLRRTMSI